MNIPDVPPPTEPSDRDLTRLLEACVEGEAAARDALVDRTYAELRRIAGAQLRDSSSTLQPTALVNEAYLKLFEHADLRPDHRGQFFALAARIMRDLLVDHLRARKAARRGGDRQRISLDPQAAQQAGPSFDALAVCEALDELQRIDPEQHEIVELRFFTGLEMTEIAAATGRSRATVQREWRAARAWLAARLTGPED